jgi:hypothetical protein
MAQGEVLLNEAPDRLLLLSLCSLVDAFPVETSPLLSDWVYPKFYLVLETQITGLLLEFGTVLGPAFALQHEPPQDFWPLSARQ